MLTVLFVLHLPLTWIDRRWTAVASREQRPSARRKAEKGEAEAASTHVSVFAGRCHVQEHRYQEEPLVTSQISPCRMTSEIRQANGDFLLDPATRISGYVSTIAVVTGLKNEKQYISGEEAVKRSKRRHIRHRRRQHSQRPPARRMAPTPQR
jgi:hypothetical protein